MILQAESTKKIVHAACGYKCRNGQGAGLNGIAPRADRRRGERMSMGGRTQRAQRTQCTRGTPIGWRRGEGAALTRGEADEEEGARMAWEKGRRGRRELG